MRAYCLLILQVAPQQEGSWDPNPNPHPNPHPNQAAPQQEGSWDPNPNPHPHPHPNPNPHPNQAAPEQEGPWERATADLMTHDVPGRQWWHLTPQVNTLTLAP